MNARGRAFARPTGNRGHNSGGTAASESLCFRRILQRYGSGRLARFFFHLHDGRTTPDRTGIEFPDWQAARRHAVRLAGEVISAEPDCVELGELWHMEVADEEGLSLLRIDFHVTLSPAMVHARARKGQLM